MSFNAEQRKLSVILSGDFKYVIPRYQRKYVWQEKQWRELFDDIKYCIDVEEEKKKDDVNIEWTHFLGSFVFESQGKDLIVIDGQQRLTTITLMLCAICVLFNELGDEPHFRGVIKYILGTDDIGASFARVDNQDLKNFQLIVDEATDYNKMQSKSNLFSGSFLDNSPQDNVNVKKCFLFFYDHFKDMMMSSDEPTEKLSYIREKITGLDVIDIRATNEQESYNIFEILNARGVDLKQHELIKNYIFKYIHPRSNVDTAKIKWDSMEAKLYVKRESRMDAFFTHYVSHRYEKPSKDNSEFRIIKQYCDRQNMSLLLDDLCEKAGFYRMFFCPDECENDIIRNALQFFSDNNHRQFRPLFLSIISAYKHKKITENEAEEFFVFIRNFYFGYSVVCDGKSNAIEDMVYQSARKIENEDASKAIEELKVKLKNHYPDYQTFEASFLRLGWSHHVKFYKTPSRKKEMRYILSGIEEYYLSQNKELSIQSFSIEHIANDDGADVHCTIGNLLMLAEPINNNAADKTFKEKVTYYTRSNFITTKNFVERYGDQDEWSDENIKDRAKHMATLAYSTIWKLS